jgi:2'-5' RNA ligase
LFLALWPTDDVRGWISDDTEAFAVQSGGRPVPPANYHVTLAFLGQVRENSLPDIVRAMECVRFNPFSLSLEHLGYWPNSKSAWLAPRETPLELAALVDHIWNRLEDLGFLREEFSDYRPHVTLARGANQVDASRLYEAIDWPVNSFCLAMSAPGNGGPVYTVLEQFDAGA